MKHEGMEFAEQVERTPALTGDSGVSTSIANGTFRSWQQPRKAHAMKKFMILAVLSVAISLQAGAAEPNSLGRYSSRAALLAPRVTTQALPTTKAASSDSSSRLAFLAPRPGLVVASIQPLDPVRYNTKAGLRGPMLGETEMATVK
jgi:hypothetical protein